MTNIKLLPARNIGVGKCCGLFFFSYALAPRLPSFNCLWWAGSGQLWQPIGWNGRVDTAGFYGHYGVSQRWSFQNCGEGWGHIDSFGELKEFFALLRIRAPLLRHNTLNFIPTKISQIQGHGMSWLPSWNFAFLDRFQQPKRKKKHPHDHGKNIIISFSLAIRCVLNFPWIFQTSGRSFSDLFFELLPLLFLILLQFNIAISSTSSDLELLILSSASFLLHCRVSFWHWRLSAGIHFPFPLMKVLVFMSPSLSTTTVL